MVFYGDSYFIELGFEINDSDEQNGKNTSIISSMTIIVS